MIFSFVQATMDNDQQDNKRCVKSKDYLYYLGRFCFRY